MKKKAPRLDQIIGVASFLSHLCGSLTSDSDALGTLELIDSSQPKIFRQPKINKTAHTNSCMTGSNVILWLPRTRLRVP
jgi:hypothetical protein